jgi:hypothetical protein
MLEIYAATRPSARWPQSPDDELVFLPLGGSNEIGMNFNLYGYGRRTTASGSSSTWA